MRTSTIVIAGLWSLSLATNASAQVRTVASPPGSGQGTGGFATPIGVIAIEPFEGARPVTGAPYKAEAITETTQVFADGNRIDRRTTASIARDTKGRIRREQQALVLGGLVVENHVPLVTITDAAAGTHVMLDRERRVALRSKTPTFDPASGRGFNAAAGPESQRGPAKTPGSPDGAEIRTAQLGERKIEGVRAEGIRTTMTIPVNAVGNRSPIKVVSERWYSPELQAVVLSQRSDPRFGETTYRLVKIVRAEPPAELFEIPADYRIEEQTLPPPPPAPRQ